MNLLSTPRPPRTRWGHRRAIVHLRAVLGRGRRRIGGCLARIPILASVARAAALFGLTSVFAQAADEAETFSTPEAAVDALVQAAGAADRDALRRLLGLRADELVSADQVQVTNELSEFTAAYQVRHRLVHDSETTVVLEIGAGGWPFPIPIVKRDGFWHFDTDAGLEELINRRIGRNELSVLAVARAYVDAQRDYASRDRDGDQVLEYAALFASSPGLKDGLYWPPDLDGEISPLGPLVALAQSVGYRKKGSDGEREPFHGYFFKILHRQGRHAPGGRYSYHINGNMIGGFALIAWPAQYGESGVMTFIVNHQGRVYQRDLGPRTEKIALGLRSYDPDERWKPSPD